MRFTPTTPSASCSRAESRSIAADGGSQATYTLVETLSRYTRARISIALGVPTLRQMIDDEYENLAGGRVEAIGRLFKNSVKVYVYPTIDSGSDEIVTSDTVAISEPMRNLYRYLLDNRRIEAIQHYDASLLRIRTREVLARLRRGDAGWESSVRHRSRVAPIQAARRLRGIRCPRVQPSSSDDDDPLLPTKGMFR